MNVGVFLCLNKRVKKLNCTEAFIEHQLDMLVWDLCLIHSVNTPGKQGVYRETEIMGCFMRWKGFSYKEMSSGGVVG